MEANNMKAVREALKAVRMFLDGYTVNNLELRRMVDAALAAPVRNCDVGAAKEQVVRFDAFVRDRRGDLDCTGKCPAHNGVDFGVVDCVLQWAQMPYEEGDTK